VKPTHTKLSRHRFKPDPDLHDRILNVQYCRCGALEAHERHDVTAASAVAADAAALAARILGEREDE
jgi:hypothetical protein